MLAIGVIPLTGTALILCSFLYISMSGALYDAGLDALLWQMYPPILAVGCLLRYHCYHKQAHCFYLGALIKSYGTNKQEFKVLLAKITLYLTAYPLAFVIFELALS